MNEQNETLAHQEMEMGAVQQKNIDYLKTGLYYMGFPEKGLTDEMVGNIMEGKDAFQLSETRTFNNKDFNYTLDFKRSEREGSQIYFWNGYNVAMQDNADRTMQVEVRQNSGFTAKESANLLSGLAVCKDQKNSAGVSSTVWHEMDFTKKNEQGQPLMNSYYGNHGFDLKEALSKLPVKLEKGEGIPDWLLRAVKKGNMPEVSVMHKGEEARCFLVANPKDRTVDVYGEKGEQLMRGEGVDTTLQNKEQAQQERAVDRSVKRNVVLDNVLKVKDVKEDKKVVGRKPPKTQQHTNNVPKSKGRKR